MHKTVMTGLLVALMMSASARAKCPPSNDPEVQEQVDDWLVGTFEAQGLTAWPYVRESWQRQAILRDQQGAVCVYRVRTQVQVWQTRGYKVVPMEAWARFGEVDGKLIAVHD